MMARTPTSASAMIANQGYATREFSGVSSHRSARSMEGSRTSTLRPPRPARDHPMHDEQHDGT